MRTLIQIVVPARGLPFVRLRARNGETLLVSETYTTLANAERAAEGLKRRLLFARLETVYL